MKNNTFIVINGFTYWFDQTLKPKTSEIGFTQKALDIDRPELAVRRIKTEKIFNRLMWYLSFDWLFWSINEFDKVVWEDGSWNYKSDIIKVIGTDNPKFTDIYYNTKNS